MDCNQTHFYTLICDKVSRERSIFLENWIITHFFVLELHVIVCQINYLKVVNINLINKHKL